MATSFGALSTDFYINAKLAVKMDMPGERETVLHFFDRVRKSVPAMNRFRRYDGELALESGRTEAEYQWLALRRNCLRTGHVNPDSMDAASGFHKLMLELAPFHLTLSALDIDYLEVLFGFDLECEDRDHDEVVYEALYANTKLGDVARPLDEAPDGRRTYKVTKVLDVQPIFGVQLDDPGQTQAYFEVKTRPRNRRGKASRNGEPISLFLTARRYGPCDSLDHLGAWYGGLAQTCQTLCEDRLIPDLLTPISRLITSGSA